MNRKKINFVTIVVTLIVLLVIIYFMRGVVNIIKLDRQEKELEKYNQELLQKKEELLIIYESVKSPEYLENEARSKLKLVRPEETIYVFVGDDSAKTKD